VQLSWDPFDGGLTKASSRKRKAISPSPKINCTAFNSRSFPMWLNPMSTCARRTAVADRNAELANAQKMSRIAEGRTRGHRHFRRCHHRAALLVGAQTDRAAAIAAIDTAAPPSPTPSAPPCPQRHNGMTGKVGALVRDGVREPLITDCRSEFGRARAPSS